MKTMASNMEMSFRCETNRNGSTCEAKRTRLKKKIMPRFFNRYCSTQWYCSIAWNRRARIQFRRVHFGVRVFNVSLCASSVQLGLDLTCFVIRHPSGKKCMITKRDTPTPHQHNKFLVPGGFSWLFMVPGWFFMVPGWFSWFFMVFHNSRLVFHGSRLIFHGSRPVFTAFHGSRLVFHGSRSVLMVFHGSRLVFHGSRSVFYGSRLVFMAFHGSRLVF